MHIIQQFDYPFLILRHIHSIIRFDLSSIDEFFRLLLTYAHDVLQFYMLISFPLLTENPDKSKKNKTQEEKHNIFVFTWQQNDNLCHPVLQVLDSWLYVILRIQNSPHTRLITAKYKFLDQVDFSISCVFKYFKVSSSFYGLRERIYP